MSKLITLEETAEYLRVTKKTISRLVNAGKIPASKVGKQWRFNKEKIDEWLLKNSSNKKASILIIDDEESVRVVFKDTLEELGHKAFVARTAIEGLELAKSLDVALVFLDLKMPVMSGVEVFREIKKVKPNLPVIIITGYPDSSMMAQALGQGPFGVMNKPFDESEIVTAVNNFLRINV